ncbi:MAG TPA: galactose oxidase, partial [Thermoanaerobaculia bacterium]|nr:galactose oxidase [Thermoanaerobaculia bacterium]
YDPLSDSWTATSPAGVPTARALHTAVWTGTEMVVWGGTNATQSTALNTGGRYDPVLDTWTATPTAGGPSARYNHTAVWDAADGVMLVWGGVDAGNNPFNDGGRLNVGFASWGLITTLNAPSARHLHTAVWTGTQMIVWGGFDNTNVLNTGGVYTLSTFSWASTDTTTAPLARADHVAVWTGSYMIVWGGYNAGDLGTGAYYSPSGNVWNPISNVGAPPPRSFATAVWTGSKMIVWGGRFSVSTGGLYDPSDDSWIATTRIRAPAGRWEHTAVWTGSRMIVWGGQGFGVFNTGAQYRFLSLYLKN